MTNHDSNETNTRTAQERDTVSDIERQTDPAANSRSSERSDEVYREAARDEEPDDMDETDLHVFRDLNGQPIRIMTEEAYQLAMQNRGHR